MLSIFTVVDAIYDSNPGDLIVIDEPELSLHPSLQRKLAQVLLDFSADRQIIIATHSPFFISWESLRNGGSIARVVKENARSVIYQMPVSMRDVINGLISNLNNPHVLGLDAKEMFFLEENINIVEGQEDVVFLKRALLLLGIDLKGSFFGWGIGGATNLPNILLLLTHLGFTKVACLLDNNMRELAERMAKLYPNYSFFIFPTDDIRDKKPVKARDQIEGLMDSSGENVKEHYREEVAQTISQINDYHSN
ncbi:ATP-binding protein [Dyadobacter chenwenxiniae]|uniref:ATP-binding protein n=1 Tax=Dyadobacter chenwenxiniae TaxID=2906456 RepID=A0A9X1PKK5_9BACT|nr:ATP-binding protein [Dyadobacter chenwenxiniae]UON85035.1 ATP-binding protein [Dyadobacter chenwenxiniae]